MVTGIGALTPLGASAPETWRGLLEGRSGIGPVTMFDASDLPVRIAAEIKGFDGERELGTKRYRRSARFSQLAVVAAREAIADAGLDVAVAPERIGVVINSAVAGVPETEQNVLGLASGGPREVSAYYVPSMITNMAACEVAIDHQLHGPVDASALACASGTHALLAARRLDPDGRRRRRDRRRRGLHRSRGVGVHGPVEDGPDVRAQRRARARGRPFQADRDGFVFGEGAVVMVVESAAHAAQREARIYGSIAGGALTGDAFHISAPEPSGVYAARAIPSRSRTPASRRRSSTTSAPTGQRPRPTTAPRRGRSGSRSATPLTRSRSVRRSRWSAI